ncbi:hypothetical protein BS47DRAFT_723038 [Hydnum rufescens UP504]|uniref:Uncharacterized protein n=1 Tax=Hydnum rufescens UP504 TaxID=1448309 RepID=A0A9P6B1A6_9AGAM|nr:hypothetical protein BS47DRAFT_723038 [Hydnum rufescens UP504]
MGSLGESAPPYAAIETSHHHHGHIHSAEASPPTYEAYPTCLPETFPIGRTKTTPVVSTDLLQAHLTILGAFDALHQKVRQVGANDPDAAWAVFLARAVYRFQKWAPCAKFADTEVSPMPPLDVLMVWHSYLLNPRIYFEDGLRVFPNLLAIPSFPLLYISTTISPITFLPDTPAHFHKSSWESQTHLPYEYTLITARSETLDVPCPTCEGEVMVPVPWITDAGTGFAQRNFHAQCEYCKRSFSREAMCVRKFCNDVVRVRESPSNCFLAGTLLNPVTGARSDADAKLLNERLILTSIFKDETAAGVARKLNFRLRNVRTYTAASFHGILPQRIRRSLACYDDPSPFSLELTGAVLRQGSFIQKMVGLGWTAPGRFSGSAGDLNDVHVLVRCIARYHAFLDLMTSGVTFFVPTIDIDLAWHTHQLLNNKYTSDTTALIVASQTTTIK